MDTAKRIVRSILLGFVLLSIGFALGRHSMGGSSKEEPILSTPVQVYYFHASFRCPTCNSLESMTRQVLETRFKRELASGAISFSSADFQKDEALARRFDVASGCVVVASGERFKRLDGIWTLKSDQAAFDDYIASAVNEISGGVR
jgi:hypothetical protein